MNEMMMSPSVPRTPSWELLLLPSPHKTTWGEWRTQPGARGGERPGAGALPSPAPASLRLQDAPGQRGGGGAGCPGPQAEPRGYCR